MKTKKIVIDIRTIGRARTGSENVVLNMTKQVIAQDTRNQYVLLTDMQTPERLLYIKETLDIDKRENVHIVTLRVPHRLVWVAWAVWRYLYAHPCDIYYTEYIVPLFIPKKIRIVTHIHDVSFKAVRAMIGRKDLFFLDIMMPRSLRRADAIIAVSNFTRDEIVRYYPYVQKKVHVIYNACAQKYKEHRGNDTLVAVRTKYNLPENYIFAIGTMQPRKNIPFLIEAFARFAQRVDDVTLVLSGREAHNFDTIIHDTVARHGILHKHIIFTGYVEVEDLPAVYTQARIFVYPSLYEGFGIPLLEAMWSNVPIATSDLLVHHEIATMAARYFDPQDIDQCAQVLYDLYHSQQIRKDLCAQAQHRRTEFSWEKSAREMQALMDAL